MIPHQYFASFCSVSIVISEGKKLKVIDKEETQQSYCIIHGTLQI